MDLSEHFQFSKLRVETIYNIQINKYTRFGFILI